MNITHDVEQSLLSSLGDSDIMLSQKGADYFNATESKNGTTLD